MNYLERFPPNKFLEAMSDFHLLMFLATSDMLPVKVSVSEYRILAGAPLRVGGRKGAEF